MNSIVIATRESRLALWQASHVQALLKERLALDAALLGMTTRGDQIVDRTLSKVGGKGLSSRSSSSRSNRAPRISRCIR
jgi:hydroxymethylbilane synthase